MGMVRDGIKAAAAAFAVNRLVGRLAPENRMLRRGVRIGGAAGVVIPLARAGVRRFRSGREEPTNL